MAKKSVSHFLIFFAIDFLFNMASNFAHPVTPTLIVERGLDASMFGVAFAAMMTMYFLFSPLWGRLCSYMPVKRILLICCLGYAGGQALFALAQNETAVILGRMFAGSFAGGFYVGRTNYTITFCGQDKEERGRKLVTLATLQAVGDALGYFTGGLLGVISVETAFMTQILVILCCGILWTLFCPDDTPYKSVPEHPLTLKEINPFSAIYAARNFMTPVLAVIFLITASASVGQYSYEQCFNYYLKDQYGLSSAYNGIFKALIAVLTLLLNSTVAVWLRRRTDINRSFFYVLLACAGLLGMILFNGPRWLFIAVYILFSSCVTLYLPLLQMLVTGRSQPENRNEMIGFYQAMNSFGGIFGALFAGLIYAQGAKLPFILAFLSYCLALFLALHYRRIGKSESAGR